LNARRSRLDRLLAKHLGISPDAVRPMLAQRRIKVDGVIADARAQLVDGFSVITIDGELIQSRLARYIMLNKPCGVLSATRDPRHPVVTDLIPGSTDLHIAGRLDLHASGLLLLTNDGAWSRRLSAPESGVSKQYEVTLRDPLNPDYITAFAAGMDFPYEDITTRPALLEIFGERTARVTLQEGRYHQLKRMFGRFRNPVLRIHRSAVGALKLDASLLPGEWRELTREEQRAAVSAETNDRGSGSALQCP
jgi:16S rRNA pseudouridine516 synthase